MQEGMIAMKDENKTAGHTGEGIENTDNSKKPKRRDRDEEFERKNLIRQNW